MKKTRSREILGTTPWKYYKERIKRFFFWPIDMIIYRRLYLRHQARLAPENRYEILSGLYSNIFDLPISWKDKLSMLKAFENSKKFTLPTK